MSHTTPEYDESVFNAAETVRDYERAYKEVKKEMAAAKRAGKDIGGMAYGNWMRSRRISEFEWFEEQQAKGIHEVAHFNDDYPVCTCGLIVELDDFDDDSPSELKGFLEAPGHWDHVAGAVIETGGDA